jgi:LuxR family maltose regulon positive regulatory protein
MTGRQEVTACGASRLSVAGESAVPRHAMIYTVGPAGESDRAAGVTRPGNTGVVARTELFARLSGSARVTVLSAPPGSGKTVLLRSWIAEAASPADAAWVAVARDGRDQQRFWLSVLGALGRTRSGSAAVRALTPAPDLDGWLIVEQLLTDLDSLEDRLWLVIDDVHTLGEGETLRQLELLVMRAPPQLRFVLATRHDLRLGLHRLRLEGELTEIRAADLRFTRAEARMMLETAGVELAEPTLTLLHQRTEGWAAGLRLAALSLAGHPDPERFAAEFSGSERTVAEYLLAEVLERQRPEVRRLLLRTSILERVSGELADLLSGGSGGERVLQDLEQANAFVVSTDPARSWFRYHQMFADFLQLELRRTAPGEMAALHRSAGGWLTRHGYAAEGVRHAQAAQDWGLAARQLADHWHSLQLDGQAATAHELLAGFPPEAAAADAELAALAAADELAHGSLEAAQGYLRLAEQGSVPAGRAGQADVLLGVVRLELARRRGDLPAVRDQARQLGATAEALGTEASLIAQPRLREDLRGLALISLGITEYWVGSRDARRHLEQGVALAARTGRPFLELSGLAYEAALDLTQSSYTQAAELGLKVVELARRHGWTGEPPAGIACTVLGAALAWRGRLAEAEPWVQEAERVLRARADPAGAAGLYYVRGVLELGRAQDTDALAALEAAERIAADLAAPHYLVPNVRALRVHALVRLGQTGQAGQILDGLGGEDRERGEIRIAAAALRLARDDPHGATVALRPVLVGTAPLLRRTWPVAAFLLEAVARETLGDPAGAGQALERALDLAEPEGALWYFLLRPAPELLKRHSGHRTAHAGLVADILGLLAARGLAPPGAGLRPPLEPLSAAELRVLRYLPTNLTLPEVARELSVSRNTVKTHMRNLGAKLGTHGRAETVDHARALGLIAPSGRRP